MQFRSTLQITTEHIKSYKLATQPSISAVVAHLYSMKIAPKVSSIGSGKDFEGKYAIFHENAELLRWWIMCFILRGSSFDCRQ